MNHFFRLFYVASVLFILLGLFGRTQDHSGSDKEATQATTEQLLPNAGILTQPQELPSPASLNINSPLSGSAPHEPLRSLEDRFTTLAKQELLVFELIFRDIKFHLQLRTGPFLCNTPRNEIRS